MKDPEDAASGWLPWGGAFVSLVWRGIRITKSQSVTGGSRPRTQIFSSSSSLGWWKGWEEHSNWMIFCNFFQTTFDPSFQVPISRYVSKSIFVMQDLSCGVTGFTNADPAQRGSSVPNRGSKGNRRWRLMLASSTSGTTTTGSTLVRVPNLYFGSRLGVQYPKNSKIFL